LKYAIRLKWVDNLITGRLPDYIIGVTELNLNIEGKIPASIDLLKRSNSGYVKIDINSNKMY